MHPADCAVGRRKRLVVLPFAGDVDDTMRIADGAFFARARYREFSAVGVNQLKIFSAAFAQGVRRLRACPVAADAGVVDVEIVAVFAVRDIVVCEIFGDHIINIIRFIWSLSTKNCRYFIYFYIFLKKSHIVFLHAAFLWVKTLPYGRSEQHIIWFARARVRRKEKRARDEYVVSFGLRAFTLDGKGKNDFSGAKAQKIEKNRKIFKFFFKNA